MLPTFPYFCLPWPFSRQPKLSVPCRWLPKKSYFLLSFENALKSHVYFGPPTFLPDVIKYAVFFEASPLKVKSPACFENWILTFISNESLPGPTWRWRGWGLCSTTRNSRGWTTATWTSSTGLRASLTTTPGETVLVLVTFGQTGPGTTWTAETILALVVFASSHRYEEIYGLAS